MDRVEAKSFRIAGLPNIRDERFDLSSTGVSLILGRNFDSSNHNTNAAGKSFFFSELAELLAQSHLSGTRADISRKGLREFVFSKGKDVYTVERSFSPREKVRIFKNGKDLEYRELAAAKKKVASLLPYTEAEVRTLLYINSQEPHPIVKGDSETRRRFFTRFFRMHAATDMRKRVKVELDNLKTAAGELKELSRSLSSLKERLEKTNSKDLELKLASLESRVSILQERARKYRDVKQVSDLFLSQKETISKLEGLDVTTSSELRTKLSSVESELEKVRRNLSKWEEYEESLQQFDSVKSKRERLERKIDSKYLEDPSKWVDTLRSKRKRLREELEELEASFTRTRKELLRVRSEEDIQGDIDEQKSRRKDLKNKIGTCPTCGGPFDNKHAAKSLKSVEATLVELTEELEKSRSASKSLKSEMKELSPKIESIKSRLDGLNSQISLLEDYRDLPSGDILKKPTTNRQELRSRKAELQEIRSTLEVDGRIALKAKKEYEALSKEERVIAKGEDPTEDLMATTERLGRIRGELADVKDAESEYTELVARKRSLKSALAEQEVLELLYDGLSKNGAPLMMIKTICQRLTHLVNRYSKHIFPEDYEFSFEMEPMFSFTVKRKYKGKIFTSDIRKLSGAESLLFGLILYAALMSFVSPSKRMNFLILDEPTAAFGPEMIESFIRFLPVLNKVVPHIIVITPMQHQAYPGAKVFTVVKKDGVSQIFQGSSVSLEDVNVSRRSWSSTAKSSRPRAVRKRSRN